MGALLHGLQHGLEPSLYFLFLPGPQLGLAPLFV